MAQDLHTLLTAARDDAPPPRLSVDDITAAGQHLVRRRRRLTLLSSVTGGAVAAVAAVTAALVMAAPSTLTPAVDPSRIPGTSAPPVAAAFVEGAPFTTTYKGYDAGVYSVSDPDLVTPLYQQSSINATLKLPAAPSASAPAPPALSASAVSPGKREAMPGPLRGGTLVVYRTGAFDPREFTPAEKVDLRSGTGILHYSGGMAAPQVTPPDLALIDKLGIGVPTLTWQYSDNAWAAIYWSTWETTPTRDELVTIADGLTPAAPKAFPIGFQLKFPPKGYTLLSASFGQDLRSGDRVVSAARLSVKTPQAPLTRPFNFDEWAPVSLLLGRTDARNIPAGKPTCDPDGQVCIRLTGDGTVYLQVETSSAKIAGMGEPTQLVLSMAPEDPDNRDSWPPATKIFP